MDKCCNGFRAGKQLAAHCLQYMNCKLNRNSDPEPPNLKPDPKPAMSNPNGLLSQKLCHCLHQGRTLNDILMRAAYWMAYFDLNKLNLA